MLSNKGPLFKNMIHAYEAWAVTKRTWVSQQQETRDIMHLDKLNAGVRGTFEQISRRIDTSEQRSTGTNRMMEDVQARLVAMEQQMAQVLSALQRLTQQPQHQQVHREQQQQQQQEQEEKEGERDEEGQQQEQQQEIASMFCCFCRHHVVCVQL